MRLSDEKNRLEHGLRERLQELTEQFRLEQVRYHCCRVRAPLSQMRRLTLVDDCVCCCWTSLCPVVPPAYRLHVKKVSPGNSSCEIE